MNRSTFILITSLTVAFCSCSSHTPVDGEIIDGKVIYYWVNGEVKARMSRDSSKEKHGLCEFYYDDGSLEQEEMYKHGLLHGEMKSYYRNGAVKAIIPYENGMKEGLVIEFTSNGDTMAKSPYHLDKVDGIVIGFYESGKIHFRNEFVNGHRKSTTEFTEDGKVKSQTANVELFLHDNVTFTSGREGEICIHIQNVYAMDSAKAYLNISGPAQLASSIVKPENGITYHKFTPRATGTYTVTASITDWAVTENDVIYSDEDTMLIDVK